VKADMPTQAALFDDFFQRGREARTEYLDLSLSQFLTLTTKSRTRVHTVRRFDLKNRQGIL
jgi:hypothetical protein